MPYIYASHFLWNYSGHFQVAFVVLWVQNTSHDKRACICEGDVQFVCALIDPTMSVKRHLSGFIIPSSVAATSSEVAYSSG